VRVLLVNPAYPDAYWRLNHLMPFVQRRSLMAPLGLITVAALLPSHWECRLVDLEFEALGDEQLAWADLVLLTGMIVQRRSMQAVLRRCHRLEVRTVVGGPFATSMPETLGDADHLLLGEAEDVLGEMAADLESGRARRIYRENGKPDMAASPMPRFDLLEPGAYHYLALQFSRGCPYLCEFCDITTLYGRRPRTKTPEQVVAELDAIRRLGYRGRVMFVDDNFIGNRKAVRPVLRAIASWRQRTGAPIDFFTEVSINLADDPELVELMAEAAFASIFIGIETPSKASLRETRKMQNLRGDPVEQLQRLRRAGLETWGGFVIGFDNDGPGIFDAMIDFVQRAGVAYATVNLLTALPHTPLHERLTREGRLREEDVNGDYMAFSNVVMKLPPETVLEGYARVLETLYTPEVFFERCRIHLADWEERPGLVPASWADLPVLWRSIWALGIRGPYRRAYWSFLAWVLRHHPSKLGLAISQTCAGHHFITYTHEAAVPNLRAALRELEAESITSIAVSA